MRVADCLSWRLDVIDPARLRSVSPKKLLRHFRDHGGEVGAQTPVDYEESARETVRQGQRQGTRFTYEDIQSSQQRVGYFDRLTGQLTALTESERRIVTHFVPTRGEQYCRTRQYPTYPF